VREAFSVLLTKGLEFAVENVLNKYDIGNSLPPSRRR